MPFGKHQAKGTISLLWLSMCQNFHYNKFSYRVNLTWFSNLRTHVLEQWYVNIKPLLLTIHLNSLTKCNFQIFVFIFNKIQFAALKKQTSYMTLSKGES